MFHVLKINYEKPIEVIDRPVPPTSPGSPTRSPRAGSCSPDGSIPAAGGVLITGDISTEDAQSMIDRDPYTLAGVVSYERLSFNAGIRAPSM